MVYRLPDRDEHSHHILSDYELHIAQRIFPDGCMECVAQTIEERPEVSPPFIFLAELHNMTEAESELEEIPDA